MLILSYNGQVAEEINVERVNRKYQKDKYGVYAENGSTKWSALLAPEREIERLGQITRVLQGIVDFLPHFAVSLSQRETKDQGQGNKYHAPWGSGMQGFGDLTGAVKPRATR
ncbi:MAG: hypothetical protein Q9196_007495, partial [Gyalolechia fulgens]